MDIVLSRFIQCDQIACIHLYTLSYNSYTKLTLNRNFVKIFPNIRYTGDAAFHPDGEKLALLFELNN